MKKFITILLFLGVFYGNPLTTGHFIAPSGEIIWWKWYGKELGCISSYGDCLWNDEKTRQCTLKEFSSLLTITK